MKRSVLNLSPTVATAAAAGLVAFSLAGCASYPTPVQRMADAESTARSAQDSGAATDPQGQLHLKLAQEEIAQAKQLVQGADNQRADFVLIRAKADAELALGEARAKKAEADAQSALQQVATLQANVANAPTSITTTTSSAVSSPPLPHTTSTSTTTTTTTQGGKP
jgi:hypothetical protein